MILPLTVSIKMLLNAYYYVMPAKVSFPAFSASRSMCWYTPLTVGLCPQVLQLIHKFCQQILVHRFSNSWTIKMLFFRESSAKIKSS